MSSLFKYYDEELTVHHTIDAIPPDVGLSLHQHDMYEIFYLISGKGSFYVEGNIYDLTPNTILIFRPGEMHKAIISKETPYERISIHFSHSILQSISNGDILLNCFTKRPKGRNNLLYFTDEVSGYINFCIQRMVVAENNDEMRHLAIYAGLISLLYTFNDNQVTDSVKQSIKNKPNQSVMEVINYIDLHLAENITLESISNKFFTSKSSLNRNFKRITGTTVWNYVIEKRLLIARSLIDAGSSMQHACKLCGFNDYSSFYRRYKKKYNENPKQSQIK